jgi:hypothetical protein
MEAEDPALARLVVGWLAENVIITASPADCLLGIEPSYPPGPGYVATVSEP